MLNTNVVLNQIDWNYYEPWYCSFIYPDKFIEKRNETYTAVSIEC